MGWDSSARARRMPRTRTIAIAIIVAVALAYAGVVALYALNIRGVNFVGCQEDPPGDSILLALDPTAVDAAGDRIKVTLSVQDFGPVEGPGGFPQEDLQLLVTDTDGPQTYTYAAGQIPPVIPVSFISTGEIESWPFDTHRVTFAAIAAEGGFVEGRVIPVTLCGSAHVPNWVFGSEEVAGDDTLVVDGEPVTQIALTATRSGATIAFGIVILALMVTLPVLGLVVAIRVLRGERKAEATLMSWMAAMLFATIPLRGFLPGAPPIGSWVDYLVVLWVVAGLVASLVIYAIGWLKWAPPGGRPQPARTATAPDGGSEPSAKAEFDARA